MFFCDFTQQLVKVVYRFLKRHQMCLRSVTLLSLQRSVYYCLSAGTFHSLWQTHLQPLLQHRRPPLTFPSAEMEILGGPSPFPFPSPSRLRPSRLSRRSQDVLKSGILLLMDSKHHKKVYWEAARRKSLWKGFRASRQRGRMGRRFCLCLCRIFK